MVVEAKLNFHFTTSAQICYIKAMHPVNCSVSTLIHRRNQIRLNIKYKWKSWIISPKDAGTSILYTVLVVFTSATHIDPDTNDFLKTIQSWIVIFNSSILMVVAKNLMNFDEVTVEMEVLVAGIQAIWVYLPVGLKMFDAKRMTL